MGEQYIFTIEKLTKVYNKREVLKDTVKLKSLLESGAD